MEGAMFDFLHSGDGAGAVEHINDQLKSAVVDGNLEILPTLYMHRAVWRLHLGLPANAEADLLAAQRCPLSEDAKTEVNLLLVQCYRELDRIDDEIKAAAALRASVQAGAVNSPVLMQQLLACLHSKGTEENGKSSRKDGSLSSRTTDREGSKPQHERKKGGMMSGFLSSSPSTATKTAKKVSSGASESTATAVPAVPTVKSSETSQSHAESSTPQKSAKKTSVYGKTSIEENVDDIDDEEIVSKGAWAQSSTHVPETDESQLDEVLSRDPKFLTNMSPEEQNMLAEVMGAAGRYVSGHEHLQIVDRNEAVSKCILQINSGKFQEADATLSAILKKEPTCYQALVARGTCRALAGSTSPTELKKADADFGKALEQMPLLADVWKRRSQARAALGNTEGAAKDLEECLAKCVFESRAAWLEVMHDLGSMYQKKRNFVKCRKVFKRYLEAAPKDAVTKELLSMMGLSCTAMGDITEGLTHYRNAIALDPDFKEAWLNLFQGLKECGKVAEAEQAFAHLQKLDGKGKTRSMLAYRFRAHMQQCCGQHAAGIETLTKALSPLHGKNPTEQRIECLYLRGACNHALGRLALAYADYDAAFGENVSQHVPQETLNFRAVAYYQGEICVYLNGKLDADVLHFSIDRDLDPEFKECWAKQTLPTPKLLARCPRQLKRGQKFPPSRKDAPLPSDTALASLLPIADHIGHRLQYTHQGFMNNGRQQRAAGLAAIELAQRFLTELDARRNGSHTWISAEGASASGAPDGRHAFAWRDAMDTIVRWRQIGEPNDQVLWVDRLTPEEFRNGFGSHTPMFSGQTKCVRYYMNCGRALKLFASIIQKQGYVVDADNKQVQLSDKQLQAVAAAKTPAAMFAAVGVDSWVVVPIGSTSRKSAGHTLEGTRLTITRSRDQSDAHEFSIRTPVTPTRWEDFDKELEAGFEAICSAALADDKPSAADAVLRYVYYWYNFMPLARGSAAVGYTTILSLFWALGMPISVNIPKDYQTDWEAILCQDPEEFVKELRTWLTPPEACTDAKDGHKVDANVAVYCDPRASDAFPDVMGTLGTLRKRFYALNHGTDAEKLCAGRPSSSGGSGSNNGSGRRRS